MALFSATMPARSSASPGAPERAAQISIEARTATAETIRQRYWLVSGCTSSTR
jgi:hypothetical protein